MVWEIFGIEIMGKKGHLMPQTKACILSGNTTADKLQDSMVQYDYEGAMAYTVTIVMVYGLAVIGVVALGFFRKRHSEYQSDKDVNSYLKAIDTVRDMHQKKTRLGAVAIFIQSVHDPDLKNLFLRQIPEEKEVHRSHPVENFNGEENRTNELRLGDKVNRNAGLCIKLHSKAEEGDFHDKIHGSKIKVEEEKFEQQKQALTSYDACLPERDLQIKVSVDSKDVFDDCTSCNLAVVDNKDPEMTLDHTNRTKFDIIPLNPFLNDITYNKNHCIIGQSNFEIVVDSKLQAKSDVSLEESDTESDDVYLTPRCTSPIRVDSLSAK